MLGQGLKTMLQQNKQPTRFFSQLAAAQKPIVVDRSIRTFDKCATAQT